MMDPFLIDIFIVVAPIIAILIYAMWTGQLRFDFGGGDDDSNDAGNGSH